jgi:hypothetical protein
MIWLAFARQHAYRSRFNAFAGNNHIFKMALFLSIIRIGAFVTNGLAVILHRFNMPTITL